MLEDMKEKLEFHMVTILLDVKLNLENCSIFQSQVAEQLVALSLLGYRVAILAVVENNDIFKQRIGDYLEKNRVKIFTIKKRNSLFDLLNMAVKLNKIKNGNIIKCFYVRGIWGAMVLQLASPFSRLSYTYDVRGALKDEAKAVGNFKWRQFLYVYLEKFFIKKALNITAVSKPLAEMIQNTCRIEFVKVIPCCIQFNNLVVNNQQRIFNREKLGYNLSDIVLVYSGGQSHYQKIPEMLDLWERLLDINDLKFLILTNERFGVSCYLSKRIENFGKKIKWLSLSRDQVSLHLASADIGFMLRDNRILNQSASPVKFGEYLAAGLAIVSSPGVGEVSAFIRNNELGILISPDNLTEGEKKLRKLVNHIKENRELFRTRNQNFAKTHLDWCTYAPTYKQLYGEPYKDMSYLSEII